MDKKVFSFNEINQKYQEEEREKKIDLKIERDAKDLFSKALFSLSKDDARKYARDAYDLKNDMYEYKTFLISLEENEESKLSEYKKLYEEVNKLIESDSLIKIYDRTEYKKERYNNLKISYINSLIKNRNYDEALTFLKEYENEIIECWGKEITIIGESRNQVIVSNTTGAYDTPPIEMGAGCLKNITFISKYCIDIM